MNFSKIKILWIIVGILAVILVIVTGHSFLNREETGSEVMPVPVVVEENNYEAQPVVTNTELEAVKVVVNNEPTHSVPKVDWKAKWTALIREWNKTGSDISEVLEIGDITGDGIPEAIVRYTGKGQDLNSTSSTIMMTIYKLENGKPTNSILKSEITGNESTYFMVAGFAGVPEAGAMGGTLKLLPDKQAFYSGGFSKSGSFISEDSCGVTVYKWNSQIGLFEEKESLRTQFEVPYCQGVEQKLKERGF